MKISNAVGSIIASDTQATIKSVDTALAQQSRMCTDFVEGCLESDVPISSTQPVLDAIGKSLSGMIESRSHLCTATRELIRIQRNSDLRETSFGCPRGWVDIPSKAMNVQSIKEEEA